MGRRYPIIVAMDGVGLERAEKLAEELCGLVEGFKVGLPLLLEHGAARVAAALRPRCGDAMWIADVKGADVSHVLASVARRLLGGFDYVIAHAFVGVEGALEALDPRRTILVLSMSHPGAREVIERALAPLLDVVVRFGPWGVVVPATRPEIVRWARRLLGGDVKLLAPGVGPQGARPGDALCAGADYEVVGRLIVEAPDARAAAERVGEEQRRAVSRCRARPAG